VGRRRGWERAALTGIHRTCRDSGRTIAKDITLIDLKGLGINSLKCLSVFAAINTACASNYPERSSKIFLLNAPRIFSTVWCVRATRLPHWHCPSVPRV
jgi:hypothetical protein